MVLFSFVFFLVGVSCLIGFLAARRSRRSERDYFLASQSVSPYVLAFSSSASKFSGFMFAGFMGAAFIGGTSVIWLALGLVCGSLIAAFMTIFRLQAANHGGWALSLGELITFQDGENRVWLRRFIGFLTLFFLSFYAAAQLKAGGKALEVIFDQPVYVGIALSVAVILFYCWAGGIRASIWTDTAQVAVMTLSLLVILIVAAMNEGGATELYHAFLATAPDGDQTSLFPQNLSIGGYGGLGLYFLGSIGLGVCSFGQPHVLVRVMALQEYAGTKKFFITACTFEILFIILVTLVGLSTRVILQGIDTFDAELALFLSAEKMLPPIAVGFVLAGVFSSTLSTADSQIISCSASLLRDMPEPPKDSLTLAKVGTVVITLLAATIALWADKSIFVLVVFAFAGLGTSIGSLLILRLFNISIPSWGAFLVALAGSTTVVLCYLTGLVAYINESLPAFAAAFLVFLVVKLVTRISPAKDSSPT